MLFFGRAENLRNHSNTLQEIIKSHVFYSKQNYYPQKYDDRVQTKWREKETYFQNPPHDDVP